jgi:hypothetical protein
MVLKAAFSSQVYVSRNMIQTNLDKRKKKRMVSMYMSVTGSYSGKFGGVEL